MNWREFYNLTKQGIAISDGAMGTLLQEKGMTGEDCPELWNVTHAQDIISIQRSYVEAGSQMLTTNTFGGNRIKLGNYHLESRLEELNTAAVNNSRKAANGKAIIAGSVGPTGLFIEPIGKITFEEMVDIYKQQIKVLYEAGIDVIDFETHVDLLEIKAAIIAAKETCDLPIIANMTFEKDERTVTGTTPEAAAITLEALGVDIIGTNCSTGPDNMINIVERIRPLVSVPIIVQANAGMPHIHEGKTVFDENPTSYSSKAIKMLDVGVGIIGGCCGTGPDHILQIKNDTEALGRAGANVIGGCCGTTPDHISELKNQTQKIAGNTPLFPSIPYLFLSSRYDIRIIGHDMPFVTIGERLNPTARKTLRKDILDKQYTIFKDEALKQEVAGADILDLNMGIPNADEPALMKKGIEILSTTIRIPLAIDSSNIEACRLGMRYYPGKPLLNSITAEPERLQLLPDIKKYGVAFIALPIDENGIPETAEERVQLMKIIISEAEKAGIDKKNIIADPLVLTASANQAGAKVTLETIERFTKELGLFTTAGLSNISFGLPVRQYVNRAFLTMAIANGLTTAIVNPLDEELMGLLRATDILSGRDLNSENYINLYANKKIVSGQVIPKDSVSEAKPKQTININALPPHDKAYQFILKGSGKTILPPVKELIQQGETAFDILNKYLIPAITEVGELYDKKVYFLPQLMMSAETMKFAFEYLKPILLKESSKPKGKIVFATVKGDVHDIGKNIVIILLQNHGFEVIDLGKDIPNELIVDKAIENEADIIALSALMTTTMPRMLEVIEIVKDRDLNIPVMVGGAAVTAKFAEEIGGFYSSDAIAAVKLANELLKSK